MKNRLIKKALCVALASTMVFGEALPAMAADGSADVQSAQAEVAFAEEASITYFSVGGQDTVSSGSVHISALGYLYCRWSSPGCFGSEGRPEETTGASGI